MGPWEEQAWGVKGMYVKDNVLDSLSATMQQLQEEAWGKHQIASPSPLTQFIEIHNSPHVTCQMCLGVGTSDRKLKY